MLIKNSKKLSNKYQYDDLLVRSKDPYANAKYEIILEWFKKKKIKTILNAGCGSGEFSFILAKNGYDVLGFDLDKDYIDLANKNIKKLKIENCSFVVSGIEDYKANKKFDAVIATDVLEHIKDDRKAFKKLAEFIRPKGSVVITVPAGQYLFGFHDVKLGHFRRYSLNSFKKIIPSSVNIKKLRYFGFFLIPVALLMSKFIKRSYPVAKSNNNVVLDFILKLEKKIDPILGTSALFLGEKN